MVEPGQALRNLRKQRGWTLEDVVRRLEELAHKYGTTVGVDASGVSRWERGRHRPSPYYVRLLCQVFEVTPEELGVPNRPSLFRGEGGRILLEVSPELEEQIKEAADQEGLSCQDWWVRAAEMSLMTRLFSIDPMQDKLLQRAW